MMNEKKYQSLTSQQRQWLHQAAKVGGQAYAAESERGFTDKKAKAQKDFGVTILEPDLAPWRERSEQVLVKLEAEGVIPKGLAAKAKALK
jgi:TRAP-type C4-dicarboxylate transport system substrate-binding protein